MTFSIHQTKKCIEICQYKSPIKLILLTDHFCTVKKSWPSLVERLCTGLRTLAWEVTLCVSFIDRNYFRNDRRLLPDNTCVSFDPLPGDFVTIEEGCTINILMMCNGVMNCDDCVDEVYENCMQFECAESKTLL